MHLRRCKKSFAVSKITASSWQCPSVGSMISCKHTWQPIMTTLLKNVFAIYAPSVIHRKKSQNLKGAQTHMILTCTFCNLTLLTGQGSRSQNLRKSKLGSFKVTGDGIISKLCLTDQLRHYQPTRSLRSSGSHQLVKPRHNLSFRSRAFRISAPHIWNSLPTNIREAQSLLTFRRHLKTHYFQSAFSTP